MAAGTDLAWREGCARWGVGRRPSLTANSSPRIPSSLKPNSAWVQGLKGKESDLSWNPLKSGGLFGVTQKYSEPRAFQEL